MSIEKHLWSMSSYKKQETCHLTISGYISIRIISVSEQKNVTNPVGLDLYIKRGLSWFHTLYPPQLPKTLTTDTRCGHCLVVVAESQAL